MVRKNLGRLLIVVAGGGCLVVLFFVVAPLMDESAPPMTQDGIVQEVMGSDSPEAVGSDNRAAGADGVMPVPSPLVGVRNDGEEVRVVFPVPESTAVEQESPVDESGLLQALSAEDAAAARAALEGWEAEPVAPADDLVVEPAEVAEPVRAVARQTGEPVDPGRSGDLALLPADSEALAAAKAVRLTEAEKAGGEFRAVPAPDAAVKEQLAVPQESAKAEVLPVETVSANGTGMQRVVEVHGQRRVEFDLPVPLDSRTPWEVSHPSGGVAATEAAQAGNPGLSPPPVGAGAVVPGTLRGVMGYRLPLVSRQEVPDQIISGVFIPAHTTFVILKAGSWELVDVTPEELERLREAAAAKATPATKARPVKQGWNPLRVFRKR